jgi:hypothetical protein
MLQVRAKFFHCELLPCVCIRESRAKARHLMPNFRPGLSTANADRAFALDLHSRVQGQSSAFNAQIFGLDSRM